MLKLNKPILAVAKLYFVQFIKSEILKKKNCTISALIPSFNYRCEFCFAVKVELSVILINYKSLNCVQAQ